MTGVALGFLFPATALLFDSQVLSSGSSDIIALFRQNPLHFIIALAPIVLGLTFGAIGHMQVLQIKVIEDLKRSETRQAKIAATDMVTQFGNRLKLMLDIESTEKVLKFSHLILMDLDKFKTINDIYGHDTGDAVLRAFSNVIYEIAPPGTRLYRLGGDEFVLLLPKGKEAIEIQEFVASTKTVLGATLDLEGTHLRVQTSMGIAEINSDSCDASDLLRRADLALYEAKGDKFTSHRLFAPYMAEAADNRYETEKGLTVALQNNQLFLEFQPIHDCQNDEISGAEALVRWNHPSRGTVPPFSFIEIAESTGQIIEIGNFVLREACKTAVSWPLDTFVSVNVSVLQFKKDDFIETVFGILADTGLSPKRLVLEITETLFIDDVAQLDTTLETLQLAGVRFALDDFGTGFASLNHLMNLRLNKLKLDRSLTANIATDIHTYNVVRAIVGLAKTLGTNVIIEGVEGPEQLEKVRKIGIEQVQGYYFARPMSASVFEAYLLENTGQTRQIG